MVRLLGRIFKISPRTVVVGKFDYERYLSEPPADFWGTHPHLSSEPQVTLKFATDIIDNLVANADTGLVCEFEVEKGIVISVKMFKTVAEIEEDYVKKHSEAEVSSSLREREFKFQMVLDTLVEIEKRTGACSKLDLISVLKERGIEEQEAENLIHVLRRDGTIYEPRNGYLKVT